MPLPVDVVSCVLECLPLDNALIRLACTSPVFAQAVRARCAKAESQIERAVAASGLAQLPVAEARFDGSKVWTNQRVRLVAAPPPAMTTLNWSAHLRKLVLSCPPNVTLATQGKVELRGSCIIRGATIVGNVVVASGATAVLLNCRIRDTTGIRVAARGSLTMSRCSVTAAPRAMNDRRRYVAEAGKDASLELDECSLDAAASCGIGARCAASVFLTRTKITRADAPALLLREACGSLEVRDVVVTRSCRAIDFVRCMPEMCVIDGLDVVDCATCLFMNAPEGRVHVRRLRYKRGYEADPGPPGDPCMFLYEKDPEFHMIDEIRVHVHLVDRLDNLRVSAIDGSMIKFSHGDGSSAKFHGPEVPADFSDSDPEFFEED